MLVPSEPPSPDFLFEQGEVRDRVRAAMAKLPARERRIIRLYYFGEATMKQIGEAIGVNESRVSQLHARAMQRLRKLLAARAPRRQSRPNRLARPRKRRRAASDAAWRGVVAGRPACGIGAAVRRVA